MSTLANDPLLIATDGAFDFSGDLNDPLAMATKGLFITAVSVGIVAAFTVSGEPITIIQRALSVSLSLEVPQLVSISNPAQFLTMVPINQKVRAVDALSLPESVSISPIVQSATIVKRPLFVTVKGVANDIEIILAADEAGVFLTDEAGVRLRYE